MASVPFTSTLRTNFALLMFYVREKLWHHAEELCSDTISSMDDWTFRVWRGLCYDQQGLVNEALREYKSAEGRRDTALPALMGKYLIYVRNRDTDGVNTVEREMGDDKYADHVSGWVQAAAIAWASGDVDKARDILLRFQNISMETRGSGGHAEEHRDEYTNLATIRAWVDLSTGRSAFLEKCGTWFQKVIELEAATMIADGENPGSIISDIDATMGRVAYFERKYLFQAAQDALNKLIVAYPQFTPALVVKARLLMRAEDWEQSMESVKRILAKDKKNIQALVLQALHGFVKDARYSMVTSHLGTILEVLQQKEPRNAPLYYLYGQAFSRLAGGNSSVLSLTVSFIEAACSIDPRNGEYLCELGYQHLYRGDFKTAMVKFKKASDIIDATSYDAIQACQPHLGYIKCLILTGKFEEAAQQLELQNELQAPNQRNAELSLLNAMIFWRLKKDQARTLMALDHAAEAMRIETVQQQTGIMLYVKLNAPLMLSIAHEMMQHCRNEPPDPAFRRPDAIGEKCRKHLEVLTRHIPGCTEAQIMLAKIHFVSGDLKKAQAIITTCIKRDSPMPSAYLLSAQICQYVGNVELAKQALEYALTLDFEIKDQPFYNLLHGIVLTLLDKNTEALEALQHAMQSMKNPERLTSKGRPVEPLTVPDHVTLYIQLAQTHLRLHDVDEARKTLTEAASTFRNTIQSGRVAIAQAMLLARTDVEKSIEILRQVSPKSDFYIAAKAQIAKMYLVQRQNRNKYTQSFEEVVQDVPSAQSYVALGEAYMHVQEPQKAITAYEKAKEMDPDNAELAVRIGRALVSTHDYEKALRYYLDATVSDPNALNIRADLAMLYWRLGRSESAIEALKQFPLYNEPPDSDESVLSAIERVNCALLMYKIYSSTQNGSSMALEVLLQASRFQKHVLESKMRNESRETVLQQHSVAATIATALAQNYASMKPLEPEDIERATEYFEEALKYEESNETTMLAYARFLLRIGEKAKCEQRCNAVRKMNPSSDEAVIILADMLLTEERFTEATEQFQQLLEKHPDNYVALVRYLMLLRREGRIKDAEKIIREAEARTAPTDGSFSISRIDPGLAFVKGLFLRFTYRSAEALYAFNDARTPSGNPWSELALAYMVHTYLVPGTQELWFGKKNQSEKSHNARSAESLLRHLPKGPLRSVLNAFCLLSTRETEAVEKAISILERVAKGPGNLRRTLSNFFNTSQWDTEIFGAPPNSNNGNENNNKSSMNNAAESEKQLISSTLDEHIHLQASLGLAIGLHLSGEDEKARQKIELLLESSKNDEPLFSGSSYVSIQNGEVMEQALNLKAHMDILAGNLDAATSSAEELLKLNMSSCKAWDYLGMIYERRKEYQKSSECFEKAWLLVNEADPLIGYKLAFNYVKSMKFMQAIDVSKKVLAKYPNYPKIEKDILEVAYGVLRA